METRKAPQPVSMDSRGAISARREIGRMLVALRKKARTPDGRPITIEMAAVAVEHARPTLYRMEHGRPDVRIRNNDLIVLCDYYQASDEQRRTLLALAAVSRIKGWFHPYGDVLPPGFDVYLGLESTAASIDAYEVDRVHGLLQTEEYAREMLSIPGTDGRARDEAEIERRLQVRLHRREILNRTDVPPLRLEWLLHETVLRVPVGGPAVMARQLDHINTIGKLPNVTIRVVPFSAGLHQGAHSGAFAILRFTEDVEPPTAYADGFVGDLLLSHPGQMARFDAAFAAIRSRALDAAKSRKLIADAAKEFTSA